MRVKIKDLEYLVDRLNDLTGSPKTTWSRGKDGKLTANIGNYHLSGAYGGWCVHRMMNEGGGVLTPITYGYLPKAELYQLIQSYIRGLNYTKETA